MKGYAAVSFQRNLHAITALHKFEGVALDKDPIKEIKSGPTTNTSALQFC